jgi:hypothetical protein
MKSCPTSKRRSFDAAESGVSSRRKLPARKMLLDETLEHDETRIPTDDQTWER